MDKKKSKYKDDYSLRTLAYYQREGGVYNDLITVLQRIRTKNGGRKLLAPNKILNAATDAFDMYMDRCRDNETDIIVDYGWNEMAWELYGGCVPGPLGGWEGKNERVVLCVLCVLLSRYPEFKETSVPEISEIVKEQDSSLLLNKYKGKGYGTKMFEKAVEELRKMKFKNMVIGCLKDNPSNKFYIKKGGNLVKTRIINIADEDLEENIYYFKKI